MLEETRIGDSNEASGLATSRESDDERAVVLDDFLDSIQRGDRARADALLGTHAFLAEWRGCLNDLESFAAQGGGAGLAHGAAGARSDSIPPGTPLSAETVWPREFGQYVLLGELGRGGMGIVYQARHKTLERLVALKMILASQLASPEDVRRFCVEARAAARVRHPHVVAIHEIGELHGQHYFVMDYIAGENLATRLAREPLAPETAARLLRTLAETAHHLHQHGIIHRDIKPSNVLLDAEGNPHLTDFGLAHLLEGGDGQTRTGLILGTPSYMSPEQAGGRIHQLSPRSDVYSLGAVLYEMLSGRPPFKEQQHLDTLLKVLDAEPIAPSKHRPGIPLALERICLRCLEKDPAVRYATAADLAADLQRFLDGDAVTVVADNLYRAAVRWVRRQPNLACHLLAIGLVAVIVQAHQWITPRPHAYHLRLMLMLAGGFSLSWLWEWLAARGASPDITRVGTIVGDVALVTGCLTLAAAAPGQLLVLYPLLVVASALWVQPRVVAFATASAALAVLCLVLLRPDLQSPWHYPVLVMAALVVTGSALTHIVHRLRRLS